MLERDPCRDTKGARCSTFAQEPGRCETRIERKCHWNIVSIEGVPHPGLHHEAPAADASTKTCQRVGTLLSQVQIVVLEGPDEGDVCPPEQREIGTQRTGELRTKH